MASAEGRAISGTKNFRSDGSALGNAFLEIYNNLNVVHSAYTLQANWNTEYFGELSTSGAWSTFSRMVTPYVLNLDTIPKTSQDSILKAMTGYEMQASDIKIFFQRWNTSINARNLNILSPTAQYPGIINWSQVKQWSDSLVDKHNYAISKGFASINDMNNTSRTSMDEVLDNQKNAVCASVTVQLSQQLTMTREAFEGTLEIFNGHPTDKMDSLSVNIQITDADGVPSNGLFQINTKSLTNLANVTGSGQIASQQKGSVKFIFIPEVGAAPQAPKIYNFGGTVRYFDPYAQAMINLPLSNVPLTVNPSPNLFLHYFMERNIMGDDALTSPDIEPSIPAELAVMVENQGYGPAVNMTISSAQPKIIDNEKGLAIEFKLIGSNFQGQPKNLGVTNINFGTVPPLQTRIGQWYLTSSLLGKFVSYQASVVHANSFGNPDLSLVKGVKLHELTKSIRLYGSHEDGINDFLVNDVFDIRDIPDIIYFSQGNRTAKVYEAKVGSFSAPVSTPTFTNTLSVTAVDTGWNYIKLNDPGNRRYDIVSVTRGDGQVIPLDNAWLTFVTLPVSQAPNYENKFHFVDTFPSMTPVTYTVVWKPRNTDVPKVVEITGIPGLVTSIPVTEVIVKFNKHIDAATFTYQDLNLTFQGSGNIMNASVVITQIDTATFKVNLSNFTTGNGFYNLTVQAANVQDVYGINGLTGKNVTWTQFLTVPTVQAFLGLPAGNIAASFDTIRVLFNIPIDTSTVKPVRFSVYKDSVLVPGSITIDSVSANHKLFYLSGLGNLLRQSGVYEFRVDLPNILSQTQVAGVQVQSVKLTVDNEHPQLISLEKSYAGGIDPQHVTFIKMKFNEELFGFNIAGLKLTRNGELLSLKIDQLSNTDMKTWMAGNFGFLTYPDGDYKFSVFASNYTDVLGNTGNDTGTISWTVNHSLVVAVTNISISPDKGFSETDGITSGQTFDLHFTLGSPASQVTISQTDLSGETVLAILSNVSAGSVTLPLSLNAGGNTGLKITAIGTGGGLGTGVISFFVDQVPLNGKWMLENNKSFDRQLDSVPFVFTSRLLRDTALLKSLQLFKDGTEIGTTGMQFSKVNDTLYNISRIRGINIAPGTYTISLNLEKLSKYLSGLAGSTIVPVSWVVLSTNKAPQANAGNDTTITQPGIVKLNGSGSTDPEADPITYRWVAPLGFVLNDSTVATPSFTVAQGTLPATYKFLLIVSDGFLFTTDVVNVVVDPAIAMSITGLSSNYCTSSSAVTLSGLPAGGTFSGPGTTGNTFNPKQAGPGMHTIIYTANGIAKTQNTTIIAVVNPLFTAMDTLCPGSTSPALPTTSTNGIPGTWSPAVVSNTATGLYRFTPDEGQCSKPTNIKIVVRPSVVLTTLSVPAVMVVSNAFDVSVVHTVKGQCSATNGFILRDTIPTGFTYVSSTPSGVFNNGVLSFAPTDIAANESKTFMIVLKAPDTKCAMDSVINYNSENRLVGNFVSTGVPGWIKTGSASYSADSSWMVRDSADVSVSDLTPGFTSAASDKNLSLFSFWHKYNTERGHDGGVLEYSTNSTDWKDAGALMIRNGYNTRIDTAGLPGRNAFSGSSIQFVQTVVNVSSFGTTPVAFRFRFLSDSFIGGEGWYVDNIVRVNGCGGLMKTRLLNNLGQLMDSVSVPVFVSPAGVLPLTLLTFIANKSGDNVALNWKTASEINVSRIEIEYSSDSRSWSAIGSVTAQNNNSNAYNFVHTTPVNGNNYYRLKMIDRDGKFVLSEVRMVVFDAGNANKMVLVPNPSNTFATLYIPIAAENRFIKIYNAIGSMVRQFKVDAGASQLRINTSNLAAGIYTIRNGNYIVRMVVQH